MISVTFWLFLKKGRFESYCSIRHFFQHFFWLSILSYGFLLCLIGQLNSNIASNSDALLITVPMVFIQYKDSPNYPFYGEKHFDFSTRIFYL